MFEQLTKNPILGFGVFIIVVGIIIAIQNLLSKMYMKKQSQKEVLRNLVNNHIPNGNSYEMVYASYWKRKGYAGRNTSYYYFCVAFRPWECVVIPIKSVTRKSIVLGDASYYSKDNINKIYYNEVGEVTGFTDQNGKHIMGYAVNPIVDSTIKVKCPFDIDQREECKSYYEFINRFAEIINA